MAQDTKSPAHLWARDQRLAREATLKARKEALQELVTAAHKALDYCMEHVNPEAVAVSSRLAAALTTYYETRPKTETHEANTGSQGPAQGD
jgi:ABC-type nitrate/sulfonate/bicarbonate transport system substrate-binding protein